ncbi:STAS domain-containing protein [Streptomyces sp. NPDC048481]|uniref:STAS domain-containing protein n=1 Tax=Streptomyces sp. NPDC048481 TaxID=3365557 RepID=UPI00371A70B6
MTDIENADRSNRLSVEHRVIGDVRVVTVRGEIDHDVRDVLTQALLPEAGAVRPPRTVADLSGVTFMDSSGINVFVAAHQSISGAQGWLRIAAPQESVLRVLRMVGIDALITCHPSVEQALNA